MIHHLQLCLVTHRQNQSIDSYKRFIIQAVQGGVTSVQLREKSSDISTIYDLACELKSILHPLNIPLIINDHVDIAIEVDAEGVHLGQSDTSPEDARIKLGPNKIIGWSVESLEELALANQLTCIDYVAASAVFASVTKTDCKMVWGVAGLKKMVGESKHPVVAIGGITAENIGEVMSTGACGAAVISALHDAENPITAADTLRRNMSCLKK